MPYMVWPKKKKKSPFYGNRGSERLSDSPVASQMAVGELGFEPESLGGPGAVAQDRSGGGPTPK